MTRAVFALAVAMIAWGLYMDRAIAEYPTDAGLLHSNLQRPIIALELSNTEVELSNVLARGRKWSTEVADMFRRNTHLDFVFIAIYASLALVLSRLLLARSWEWRMCVGLIAIAAIADAIEDKQILNSLDAATLSDAAAQAISIPARIKWAALCIWSALAGALALVRGPQTIWGVTTAGLAGFAILAGVVLSALSITYLPLAEAGMNWISTAMIALAIAAPFSER